MYTHIYSEFNPSNKRFISTHVYVKSFTPQLAIHPGSVFLHESKGRGGMVSRFLLVSAMGVDWHVITEVALCTTSLPGDSKWFVDSLVGFRGKRLHNIYIQPSSFWYIKNIFISKWNFSLKTPFLSSSVFSSACLPLHQDFKKITHAWHAFGQRCWRPPTMIRWKLGYQRRVLVEGVLILVGGSPNQQARPR